VNDIHNFQIDALMRFVKYSACFDRHWFIIRKAVCTNNVCMVCFLCIHVTNGLPDYELMSFVTHRRGKNLIKTLILKVGISLSYVA